MKIDGAFLKKLIPCFIALGIFFFPLLSIHAETNEAGGVGYTIEQTFSDNNMAQVIADEIGDGDVDYIIKQNDIDSITSFNESSFIGKNISDISGIEHFINLTELNLQNNNIAALSEDIGELNNLTTLNISNNQLTKLPESMELLINLSSLNLNNQDIALPTYYHSGAVRIDNMIVSFDNTFIAPLVLNENGIYENDQLVWNLGDEGFVGDLSFLFGEEISVGGAIGEFSGVVVVPVAPAINIEALNIDIVDDVTYNGKVQTPVPAITNGEEELELEKDFEVDYSDNINAGSATISVSGVGMYSGEIDMNFTITQVMPKVYSLPSASKIEAGDTLNTSVLKGGIIHGIKKDNESFEVVKGEFKWINPDAKVNKAKEYEVEFIPTDVNYTTITMMVNVDFDKNSDSNEKQTDSKLPLINLPKTGSSLLIISFVLLLLSISGAIILRRHNIKQ